MGEGVGGGGLGGRQDDTAHVRLLLVIASFLFRKPRHGRTGGRTGGESTRGRMECEGKKWIRLLETKKGRKLTWLPAGEQDGMSLPPSLHGVHPLNHKPSWDASLGATGHF